MKFGNIIYNQRNERINLGDDIQLLAIENLFHIMNISYKDVIRIELRDLWTYEGEKVIVPISFPFLSYSSENHITCFAKDIYPVFLGLSILSDSLDNNDISYLKSFEPIGCRDYHTYKTMIKYKIKAYLFGCMTMTFPQVWNAWGKKEIYAIDVSEKLISYMPFEIQKDCIFMSNAWNKAELEIKPEEKAREIYRMLIDNAKLVITARLHIALPCIAAGIPVIFAKDKYSWRFEGIDRVVNIFSEDRYSLIDWNPKPINYEHVKKIMLNIAACRLYNEIEKYDIAIKELNDCFANARISEKDEIIEFVHDTEEYLMKKMSYNDGFDYIIWSVTQIAELVYNSVASKWVNARLVAVVDKNKRVDFHGVKSVSKEIILNHKNAVILVCSDSAIPEAKELFELNNIENYFFCAQNGMWIK